MPGRTAAGKGRGRASTAAIAPDALPKTIQAAAADGKVGVVQTWLVGDGRVDATREALRTRSLDGLVGGRYSTTKAPDAAAKGPPTAPGLVVGVGCASRGGEAA